MPDEQDPATEHPTGADSSAIGPELAARLEFMMIEMARVDLAPIDLGALHADDELLDALATGRLTADDLHPEPIGPDDELVALLAAWVAESGEPPKVVSTASTRATLSADPDGKVSLRRTTIRRVWVAKPSIRPRELASSRPMVIAFAAALSLLIIAALLVVLIAL